MICIKIVWIINVNVNSLIIYIYKLIISFILEILLAEHFIYHAFLSRIDNIYSQIFSVIFICLMGNKYVILIAF